MLATVTYTCCPRVVVMRMTTLTPWPLRCVVRPDGHPQWFITVFTYNFHFEFSTRVWDCFLSEGWKVAFRVGLALLKASQRESLMPPLVAARVARHADASCGCDICRRAAVTRLRRHHDVLSRHAQAGTCARGHGFQWVAGHSPPHNAAVARRLMLRRH